MSSLSKTNVSASAAMWMLGAVMLTACVKGPYDPVDPSNNPNPGPSVETRPDNGAFEPVFEGQTRGPSATTTTSIQVDVLLRDPQLYKPWSLNFIARDEFLVAQKNGIMRIVSTNGVMGPPVKDVPPVFFNDGISGSNAGLFDMVLDPGFQHNKTIYFSFSQGTVNGSRVVVAKAKLDRAGNRLRNVSEIYRTIPDIAGTAVYGGRLVVDPNGYLMVSTGARHRDDSRYMAQNLDVSIGKILRINTEGKPAPGNPFAGIAGALPEIWAYGIRSPLGMDYHPHTGELWETEHGPMGGDEVNIIKPGVNYGWPIISYGVMYDNTPVGRGIHLVPGSTPPKYFFDPNNLTGGGISQQDGMEQPRYYWDPSIAPGGITFYRSTVISEWKNNLFVTALNGKHLIRLIVKDKKIIGEERLLAGEGVRLRDVQEGPDGALYVISDTEEGRIYRIRKK